MVKQLGIDSGQQEFNRRMNMLMQALQLGAGVAQAQPQAVPGTQGSPGLLGSFVQGAAGPLGQMVGQNFFTGRNETDPGTGIAAHATPSVLDTGGGIARRPSIFGLF